MNIRHLFFLLLAIFSAACGGDDNAENARREDLPAPAVEAVQAQIGTLPLEERLSGRVKAENQVAIFPEIAAQIVRIAVQTGDRVAAGQPLVYLRDTSYQEQLRQAEASLRVSTAEAERAAAQLREAETRLARAETLAVRQFLSIQELESERAQVASARAGHQQALARISLSRAAVEEEREALRRAVVRSPISGYVGQRNAEVGMRVEPGTQLFTVGNLDNVRVEVAIPDNMLGRILPGQTALIRTAADEEGIIRAAVSRISPFLETGSYSAAAEIDVPNSAGRLQPGMFVTVDVQYGESRQATLIPVSALYEDPATGILGVYVATGFGSEVPVELPETYSPANPPPFSEPVPMAVRRITVLARGRDAVGVQGIQPGDWVVTVGQNLLSGPKEKQPMARIRPVPWSRVTHLQLLHDQDLLRTFMEKQQRLALESESTAGNPGGTPARPTTGL